MTPELCRYCGVDLLGPGFPFWADAVDHITRHENAAKAKPDAEYKKAYNRGWRYSQRETATLDHGDANREPDAWYDGYLDLAAGREKWHCFYCRLAGGCDEHNWSEVTR